MIEFATEVEEPLGKPSEFTTGFVVLELEAKHFQQVTGGGDGIANGGRVGSKRDRSRGEGKLRNGVEMGGVLASEVKFPLQVKLSDLHIA
jgi:hypothetical protein